MTLVESDRTPIDDYLAAQATLTAVERFARWHDTDLEPAGARWWSDRLPASPPGPGQQYAFAVDLDACTGCKACVSACHNLNGLDDDESWRTVGTLHAEVGDPYLQHVTAACHHCVDPACLNGCPVDAYTKDPDTGIVRHLDDQCIGCSYCTLTCPYEVPVYNRSLGIVRKCDLCADRLGAGEAPACVQGCPNAAITVAVVDVATILSATRDAALVPGAPSSSLTAPTTTYRSATPAPTDVRPADHRSIHPSHAHTPLAVMLVLTQLAVGALVVEMVLRVSFDLGSDAAPALAFATAAVALGASVLHLGRPLAAWRAVLGIGHSWLSREIVAFGVFAAIAASFALAAAIAPDAGTTDGLGLLAAASGVAAVACSAQLYAATGRRWWTLPRTGARFATTSVLTGTLAVLAAHLLGGTTTDTAAVNRLLVAVAATTAATCVGASVLLTRRGRPANHRHTAIDLDDERTRTAVLLRHQLREQLAWRRTLALVGAAIVAPLTLAFTATDDGEVAAGLVAVAALAIVTAGELLERRMFFTASAPPRMPGVLR